MPSRADWCGFTARAPLEKGILAYLGNSFMPTFPGTRPLEYIFAQVGGKFCFYLGISWKVDPYLDQY